MEYSFTLESRTVMKQLHKGYLCRHPQKKGNRYVYPDQRDIAEGCPFMVGGDL